MHPEVTVSLVVNVARSLAEAETQLKTGVVVTSDVIDSDETLNNQTKIVSTNDDGIEVKATASSSAPSKSENTASDDKNDAED